MPAAVLGPGGLCAIRAYVVDMTIIEGADDARVAEWLGGKLEAALAATEGPVAITMPGGSTPFPILALLADRPLDWSRRLGMGADGHIASLFPNTDPRVDDPQPIRRLTPDPLPPEAPFDRITLTIPALLDSDEILFVIRGADKRAVFDAALRGEHDLPVARLLGASSQPVTCFA